MNEKINIAARKMQLVAEELLREYGFRDYYFEHIPRKQIITKERVLIDINKMLDILSEFYIANSKEDFIILFAIYCNNYIKYNFHRRIDEENFKVRDLWNVIEDKEMQKYLLLIQLGISNRNKKYFKEASEIFKEYSLPYLYLFLDSAKSVFENNDSSKKDEMVEYYNTMSNDLQKYVLGDSIYIKKQQNPAFDTNYLPYIVFEDNTLSEAIKSINQQYGNIENEDYAEYKNKKYESYKYGDEFFRLMYLNIPIRIEASIEKMCKHSIHSELILEKIKKELEKAIENKNALIDRHAHNWKHIVYPETVKEIAESLYEEGNIEYANKLFKAYNSENILQNDLQLLRLNYASSEKEMQKKFRQDILFSHAKTGLNILNIIEDSFDIVVFRTVMEGIDCSYMSEKVKRNLGAFNNIEILRESYTREFISKNEKSGTIIKWFNDNIYSVNIDIDKHWGDVKIKKNSIAYTQLIEIFINLIHNCINYGVKSKEGFINLKLEVEEINNILYYTVRFENPKDEETTIYEGSHQGIEFIKNILEKLNHITFEFDKYVKSVETITNGDLYAIKLYFSEKLIVKRRI